MRTASHLPATGWMFTTLTAGALVWTLVCPAQCRAQQHLPGYMSVKKGWFTDGSKVVLDGQTYRPFPRRRPVRRLLGSPRPF